MIILISSLIPFFFLLRRVFSNLLVGAMLTSLAACQGESSLLKSHAGTVEQLPVDRFDEYQTGALPPYPWQLVGKFSDGVKLSLESAGESEFIGNTITGKGLVMEDQSLVGGKGCGIGFSFASPPPGALYLGFDFKLPPGDGLDWVCELTDAAGDGLALRIGEGGQLQAGVIGGPVKQVVSVKPNVWYHLSVNFSDSNHAVVTLLAFDDQKNPVKSEPLVLGNRQISFQCLRFFNAGGPERTGGWVLDNVMMAGRVDSSRDELLPFRRAPETELRASPKKAYAYYYEIYPSGYSDKDPGLSPYTRQLFNPSLTPADRVKAGSELLFRPLPRPQMESGLTEDEVLIRAMEEEVRLGIQMGLDGFLLDFFALPQSYAHPAQIQDFNRRSFALMDAAARVDPAFKIIPAIYAGPKPPPGLPVGQDIETAWTAAYADSPIVRRILNHPQVLRLEDGRVLFSKWGTERYAAGWWKKVIDRLNAGKIPVAFMGQFNGLGVERLKTYSPICYAMADWGPRTPRDYHWVSKVRPFTTTVVSPVVLQDVRTRERVYWESCGSEALRTMWKEAINDGSDWVFITTWSDYTEQAQAPSTAIGFAPYDLNTYYIQWFKLGAPPAIYKDVLYSFYRIHHSEIDAGKGVRWKVVPEDGYTKANDEIELLAFLKEPGELKIQIGDQAYSRKAETGVTSFRVPLPPGRSFTPCFSLVREGRTVVSGRGRYTVLDKVEYPNPLYHAGMVLPESASPEEGTAK